MRAAGCGATACVRLLVARGGDADAASETGATALHIAALEGHSQVVSLLLKAGANPRLFSEFDGMTPVQAARQAGLVALEAELVALGADPLPPPVPRQGWLRRLRDRLVPGPRRAG